MTTISRQVLVEKGEWVWLSGFAGVSQRAGGVSSCKSEGKCGRQRSLWQWFNMTDSLEYLPTLLHFHSQELVPVRASEHTAKGLMTHPLWINTTRSDALRDFGWRQLKLQRSQLNHRRQQGHDHSAQGQQQHHHLSSCLFGCFTTSRLPTDEYVCLPLHKQSQRVNIFNIVWKGLQVVQICFVLAVNTEELLACADRDGTVKGTLTAECRNQSDSRGSIC